MQFFETSAKTGEGVKEVGVSMSKQHVMYPDASYGNCSHAMLKLLFGKGFLHLQDLHCFFILQAFKCLAHLIKNLKDSKVNLLCSCSSLQHLIFFIFT